MGESAKFISWLEGYLDCSKNKLSNNQIREIRKRISVYHSAVKTDLVPLYDAFPLNSYNQITDSTSDEFLKEIEQNKGASTMEDLTKK